MTHDNNDDADRTDGTDDSYEVGYGRPPSHTRFKKGRSGNPRGRPKASKNIGTILQETFFRKITVTENGVRKEITVLEAIFRQIANGAAKGGIRYIDRVVKLLPMLETRLGDDQLQGDAGRSPDPKADAAVLQALSEMLGANPADLFATLQAEASTDDPID